MLVRKFYFEAMTGRILLRNGVSRHGVSHVVRHEIDDVDLAENVSVLRAKAAHLLQLTVHEIGSFID